LIPNWKITQIFINSVILPLFLSIAYVYVFYNAILLEESLLDFFNSYLSLENLYTLFANENFLLIFWIHFVSLNLFLGSWVSRDGVKYNIPKGIVLVPLLLIYFTGPVGVALYWFFRVFYSKKLGFYD